MSFKQFKAEFEAVLPEGWVQSLIITKRESGGEAFCIGMVPGEGAEVAIKFRALFEWISFDAGHQQVRNTRSEFFYSEDAASAMGPLLRANPKLVKNKIDMLYYWGRYYLRFKKNPDYQPVLKQVKQYVARAKDLNELEALRNVYFRFQDQKDEGGSDANVAAAIVGLQSALRVFSAAPLQARPSIFKPAKATEEKRAGAEWGDDPAVGFYNR